MVHGPYSPLSAPPEIHAPVKVMIYHPLQRHLGQILWLTLLTTLVVGARMAYFDLPMFDAEYGLEFPGNGRLHPATLGIPFRFCSCINMGHHPLCRKYGFADHGECSCLNPIYSIPAMPYLTLGLQLHCRIRGCGGGALSFSRFRLFLRTCCQPFNFNTFPPTSGRIISAPMASFLLANRKLHLTAIARWYATALKLTGSTRWRHLIFALVIVTLLPLGYYFWAGVNVNISIINATIARVRRFPSTPGHLGTTGWRRPVTPIRIGQISQPAQK